jgi:acetyl/propionyl-CoA carboxylase alpha subunit
MFKRVLIANRGEIAARIARTLQRLGIESVAVHSDADAGAYHVRCATSAVHIGGSRPLESYLNVASLLEAIEKSGADAVHPGYGLLSEDADFARAVRGAGVTFIGPSESALDLFGDKVQARHLAAGLDLLQVPGTLEPLPADDGERAAREALRIGYPVLVKAAAGGGGIGMQRASSPAELQAAISSCRARSQAAFADDRVYLERWVERPRHIEVQVMADAHGAVRAIGDRECSAQRRHQKVIEEAPSPAAMLDQAQRARVYDQAERLIAAARYQGVATVEFILDPSLIARGLCFLEVNARLQVEHPVTELTHGLDLVEAQLRIAAGEPLSQLAWNSTPAGHAIEARLYAEDPARNFAPQPGQIERFALRPELEGLRLDTGYEAGDAITPFYDPLIAKLIAHGQTREQARQRLLEGLRGWDIAVAGPKGPRVTNRELLVRLLEAPAFIQGEYDTHLVADVIAG